MKLKNKSINNIYSNEIRQAYKKGLITLEQFLYLFSEYYLIQQDKEKQGE